MSREAFALKMVQYIPEPAVPIVYSWLENHRIKLKISKPRSSKLGDFRVRTKDAPPAISVNGNLNPYSFLITLTHEVAHLKDFEKRQTLRNAHGHSWKHTYAELLRELLQASVFPTELLPAIRSHINSPRAASCSDPRLLDALRIYDEHESHRLKELNEGDHFSLGNGRVFQRGPLRRTRYKCYEPSSGRWFLIHGEAEVDVV